MSTRTGAADDGMTRILRTYQRTSITATAAQVVTMACIRTTMDTDTPVAVVVVDDGGMIKSVVRMDDVSPACISEATEAACEALGDGPTPTARNATCGASGGCALVVDGVVVGAVGVHGSGRPLDARIARAGVDALCRFDDELNALGA